MTKKKQPPRPTDSELAILQVLWERGPCTVREVQEELERTRRTGYTTALKFLQIMHEKGLVARDESRRTHIYEARMPQEDTQRQLLDHILERAFGNSAQKLVMHVLSRKRASKKELEEVRRFLDALEEGEP